MYKNISIIVTQSTVIDIFLYIDKNGARYMAAYKCLDITENHNVKYYLLIDIDSGNTIKLNRLEMIQLFRCGNTVCNLQLSKDNRIIKKKHQISECKQISERMTLTGSILKDIVDNIARGMETSCKLSFMPYKNVDNAISKFNKSRIIGLDTQLLRVKNSCVAIRIETNIVLIANGDILLPDDAQQLFLFSRFKEIDLQGLNSSNTYSMKQMFSFSRSRIINLDKLDTRSLLTTEQMFEDYVPNILDLRGFYTGSVVNMRKMFCHSSIEKIYFGDFDTGNVETMESMFQDCNKLTELDISKFNTTNVKVMESMFRGCRLFNRMIFGNIDTHNVETMCGMFLGFRCKQDIDFSHLKMMFAGAEMENIDLSSFDTTNCIDFLGMFRKASINNRINIQNFKLQPGAITEEMFKMCSSRSIIVDDIRIKSLIQSELKDYKIYNRRT